MLWTIAGSLANDEVLGDPMIANSISEHTKCRFGNDICRTLSGFGSGALSDPLHKAKKQRCHQQQPRPHTGGSEVALP